MAKRDVRLKDGETLNLKPGGKILGWRFAGTGCPGPEPHDVIVTVDEPENG